MRGASFAVGIVLGASLILAMRPTKAQPDPFDQRNFPCQEDQVLTYNPIFGPDKTGCINIEEILP